MKKSPFFPSPIGVLAVLILIIFGCASNKKAPTIWDLLAAKDEKARGYFLGEVDVNATDEDGKTPLHYAAINNDVQLAAFFIGIGAKPNVEDNLGQTPLGISMKNVNPDVARILVSGGADIHLPFALIEENEDEEDEEPTTTITTSAVFALARGAIFFRSILTPASIESVDDNNKTVLHMASIAGNTQAVENILAVVSTPSLISKKDKQNKNALDYALDRPDSINHMVIAEQLILHGAYSENPVFNYFGPAARSANYNIRRNEGLAPIHFAVINEHIGLITFLLDKKVNINIKSTSGATALHEAMRKGNMRIISMLVEAGADVNARDANNNAPLHTGVPANIHKEAITLLLERGADPNLRDDHGDTPLHIAIILNRPLDVIQIYLEKGSDVHIRNIQGKTPLYIAVQEKRTSIIPALLAKGSEIFAADNSGVTPFDISARANDASFNLLIVPETVNQRDSAGNTMLHAAVTNRANPIQIARILDTKALADARNRDGDTALHLAVRTNQKESGEFLISRGASIFSLNSSGHSPLFLALSANSIREWIINPTTINAKDGLGNNMLHYAAEWKFNNVIPVIIRSGLSVNEPNATGETPLFMAIKTNSPPTIRVLVENNANINARDSQGNSVLHTAVRWNAVASCELLISQRIDINAHSLNGNTPLHDSIIFNANEIESMLVRSGANLEVRNIDGDTPFMEAVKSGNITAVQRLSLAKADTSTRNTRGDTPLHLAVTAEQYDIVAILLRMGTSIHARNTMGRTPFHISLSMSPKMVSTLLTPDRINISDDLGNSVIHIALQERVPTEIIRTIIASGARVNAVDSNGKTPLRLAMDMDQWDAVKLIADSGADPFLIAVDNKNPAELSFLKGETCLRALFSGRAVNARDNSGNTILHLAAQLGNPDSINVLVELGANKTIRNVSSDLPYDVAVRWNRGEIAELLR